jgi:N-acetylmuramoyl-L-alanine amidase
MKVRIFFAALLLAIPVFSFASGKKVAKIVLDAGHGGTDAGAKGQISYEKNLTLAITLRLGKIISDSLKDVQLVYTRTSDIYPSLTDRNDIANRANADLFVSVHINATAPRIERHQSGTRIVKKGNKKIRVPVYTTITHKQTQTQGTMTLVLGTIRNNEKQNAIGEYGDNIMEEPGMLNENDPQTAIIMAQYLQAFATRSISVAAKVQQEFVSAGRADLGVKQQSLQVLAGCAMPGILVECGFINNPEEEAYLNAEQGQNEIAMAIYRAIKSYKMEVEK